MTLEAADLIKKYSSTTKQFSAEDVPFRVDLGSAKEAAVLVLLFIGDDNRWHVVLTKRAHTLSTHPGETAFPGGKRDLSDANLQATALREAEEEIGLERHRVEILGGLETSVTRYGIFVTPFVGIILQNDLTALRPNIDEVVEIFTVPLEIFLKADGITPMDVKLPGMDSDKAMRLYHFIHGSHVIFGITAAVCTKVASIIYEREPEFEFKYPFHVVPVVVNKL